MVTKQEELATGCLSKAANDEPVFVLRAQDSTATHLVLEWADHAEALGVPADKVAEARKTAEQMFAWQAEFGSKVPD